MDIFLSSTAEDLAEHRLAVKQAIERLELTCVGQETFTADQRRSLDFCRDRVRRCDLVVVIVAHRYGWVPPPGQGGDGRKSITWHEVDAAGETPVLAFVVKSDDDRFRWTHGAESDQLNTATSQAEAAEIFDRIQALKEFKTSLQEQVCDFFTTPDNLAALVGTALAKYAPRAQTALPARLEAYLDVLEKRTATIKIQGIRSRHAKAAQEYPIEELFTPLRARRPVRYDASHTSVAEGADGLSLVRETPVDLTELLDDPGPLLLEGQPGAGKSTFLRLIAQMVTRARRGHQVDPSWSVLFSDGVVPVPFLVSIGDLVPLLTGTGQKRRRAQLWLLDLIEQRLTDDELELGRDAVRRWLAKAEVLLLLDGLDEVAQGTLRDAVFDIVAAVLTEWPGCRPVVTSRPIDTDRLVDLGFRRTTIEPFGWQEIEMFLDRWVRALNPSDDSYRADLQEAIARPDIRRIASNPVMLTCLAVVHFNDGRLPAGKSRLYAAVIGRLLFSRTDARAAQGYSDDFAEKTLAHLALAMMTTPEGKQAVLDIGQAVAAVEGRAARQWSQLAADERRSRLRDWLLYECVDSGVIEEIAGNRVKFWHLTFQEHLAARQLAWLGDDEQGDGQWWPIVGSS